MEGLSKKETRGLRILFAFGAPGGRSRVQKRIGAFLDGDNHALDKMPAIKRQQKGDDG